MRYPFILFDLDGTLINTNELILQSFEYTLDKVIPGLYTKELILSCWGRPLMEQMALFDPERVDELIRVYREFNRAHHDRLIARFPLVQEVIFKLKEIGCQLGIVTSKMRTSAINGLQFAGIADAFDTVVGVEDTILHKPYPEPVLLALERLNAPAAQTLMIGDSPADIESARTAGIATAGVCWSLRVDDLIRCVPNFMLTTMEDAISITNAE